MNVCPVELENITTVCLIAKVCPTGKAGKEMENFCPRDGGGNLCFEGDFFLAILSRKKVILWSNADRC